MEYGVSTQNKFAFLGDDEEVTDPEEVLQRAEKERKLKPKGKEVKLQIETTDENRGVNGEKSLSNSQKWKTQQKPQHQAQFNVRKAGEGNDLFRGGSRGGRGGPRGGDRRSGNPRSGPRPGAGNKSSDEKSEDQQEPQLSPQKWKGQRNQTQFNARKDGEGGNSFRGGPRGPRRPRGGDRHSGDPKSGPRPGAGKKGGHGSDNWGTVNDDLAAETQQNAVSGDDWGSNKAADNNSEPVNAGADDWGTGATENQEQPQGEATDENQEVNGEPKAEADQKVITLQEWKSQQKQNQAQFNVRKAGEGGDQKIYKNLVPIKKEKVEKDANTTEDEDEHQLKREPREKPLNIAISFTSSDHKRGGHREDGRRGPPRGDRPPRGERADRGEGAPRGGREGGRGGGPRRQYNNPDAPSGSGRRQNQGGQSGFNLAQESFPALGAR